MSTPLYDRSSRIVRYEAIAPELRAAMTDHTEAQYLGDLAAAATLCCQTHSVRLYKRSLIGRVLRLPAADPDPEHDAVAVLTPSHLVVATIGAKRGTTVTTRPAASSAPRWRRPSPTPSRTRRGPRSPDRRFCRANSGL